MGFCIEIFNVSVKMNLYTASQKKNSYYCIVENHVQEIFQETFIFWEFEN